MLLVEDDDTGFLMRDLLSEGIDLDVVHSADETMETVAGAEMPYDLLLHRHQPRIGRQRGRRPPPPAGDRCVRRHADTPMIAATAIAMPGDREKLLTEGFDDYLSKPFEASDLLQIVDQYLWAQPRQSAVRSLQAQAGRGSIPGGGNARLRWT